MFELPISARLLSAALLILSAGPLAAQTPAWPGRTITAVVPFGPGTAIEAAARPLFEQMAKELGQPIVIEHRPGAGGTTGAAAVARAAPDGHTLLVYSSSFSIAHSIHPNRPYDTLRDFIPVIPFGVQPNVIVTAPSKGFKTLADLIAAAKAKPGSMNYAHIGVGSAPHVAAERFRLSAGFEAQHIPFRSPPEALTETLTGRVDFYFVPLGTALPLIREGKLVPLAVSTSKRATALPDVPTTTEAGLKDSAFDLWIGLFAPAGTPPAVVERLYAEGRKALEAPAVRERLNTLAMEPMPMTSAEFAAYFRKDVEGIAELIKRAGIKAN
jgi:tripartite-type tricarboxylate transporter receptor subunit TctC